jgi:putative ABC transport system permease protein
MGQDQDDYVVMPLVVLQRRISGNNNISSIAMSVVEGRSTEKAKSQITALMRERRRIGYGQEDNFSIMDMSEFAESMSSITSALTALLAAIAAVSLIVGGIGIMNIMLVSVTERTREIGIRLAIGARGFEVLLQFLVEAIVLCCLGGLVGVGLSWLAAQGLNAVQKELHVSVDLTALAVAFAVSSVVGLVFGTLPARRAAALSPVDALARE